MEFRRISAFIYKKALRWRKAVALAKQDKLYKVRGVSVATLCMSCTCRRSAQAKAWVWLVLTGIMLAVAAASPGALRCHCRHCSVTGHHKKHCWGRLDEAAVHRKGTMQHRLGPFRLLVQQSKAGCSSAAAAASHYQQCPLAGLAILQDAMETAAQSGDVEIASELLHFFVDNKEKECFAATLYTCYDLIKPDVALEVGQ